MRTVAVRHEHQTAPVTKHSVPRAVSKYKREGINKGSTLDAVPRCWETRPTGAHISE